MFSYAYLDKFANREWRAYNVPASMGMFRGCLLVCLAVCAEAFYLPGVAPKEYIEGDRVDIKVNKLTSTKTQVRCCLHRPWLLSSLRDW